MRNFPLQYQQLQKIGEGSGGEVYVAWDTHLNQNVVLKKIKDEIKDYADNRAEVDVLKNLRHSNLPKVLNFFRSGKDVYTVMDYIPGQSFKNYVERQEYFDEKYVLKWARQVCETLVYLHSQRPPIIHSDLKPANIMLMPDGNICVIDFNISSIQGRGGAVVTGFTRGYAPPEQVQAVNYNQQEPDRRRWMSIDARADLYSLGATLYHLLTMKKPVQDPYGFTEDIRHFRPELNEVFASIIMRCLQPDPGRRYQSAEELLKDLNNIHKMDRRYKNLILRQRVFFGGIAAMAIAFAVLAGAGFLRMQSERSDEYQSLVQKEEDSRKAKDYSQMENYFTEAVTLEPNQLDAYFQKAQALDEQERYSENIVFITTEILGNRKITDGNENLGDVYYLLGNAYDQTGQYSQAAEAYRDAIERNPDSASYYRNYAIVLAHMNEIDAAEEALENARERGLVNEELLFVSGEIKLSTGRYVQAKEDFLACIAESEDNPRKRQAYLKAAECMDGIGHDEDVLGEKIRILQEGSNSLPEAYTIQIQETLAHTYTELASVSGNKECYYDAAEVYQQLIDSGRGGYDVYLNLERCYTNVQEYDRASDILYLMQSNFGENYRTYRDFAFLEDMKQRSITDPAFRDYHAFVTYYNHAVELYRSSGVENDTEMERLQRRYEELYSGGLI